jgi:hypothetical protein
VCHCVLPRGLDRAGSCGPPAIGSSRGRRCWKRTRRAPLRQLLW